MSLSLANAWPNCESFPYISKVTLLEMSLVSQPYANRRPMMARDPITIFKHYGVPMVAFRNIHDNGPTDVCYLGTECSKFLMPGKSYSSMSFHALIIPTFTSWN